MNQSLPILELEEIKKPPRKPPKTKVGVYDYEDDSEWIRSILEEMNNKEYMRNA